MALDKEFFDSVHIDIVKKKYYNANKVEAVLSEIRSRAEELQRENEELRSQVELFSGQKEEIGDAILSSKTIAQHIIRQAKEQADAILAEAQQQRTQLIEEARLRREQAATQFSGCFERVKQLQQECIDALNDEWQDFLCNLYSEDEEPASAAEQLPEDIGEKLGAIAQQIQEISEED